jgi:hypothetical protein
VIRAADNQIIDPSELANKVESGTVLEMSIVLRKLTVYQEVCPRCHYINSDITTGGGWVEWQVLLISAHIDD